MTDAPDARGYRRDCTAEGCDGEMHPTRHFVRWDCRECDNIEPIHYGDESFIDPDGDTWTDRVSGTTAGDVNALTDDGLLTMRQALAYVLREVEGHPRERSAVAMDVSTSTLDKHLLAAREKVEEARATVNRLDDFETREQRRAAEESDEEAVDA